MLVLVSSYDNICLQYLKRQTTEQIENTSGAGWVTSKLIYSDK